MLRNPVSKRSVISISLGLLAVAALLTSLFFAGTARAQDLHPVYVGKFTLTQQIHWGKSDLRPGDYTLTIMSTSSPVFAQVSTVEGITVAYVMTGDRSEKTNGVNGLLIKKKDGQPTVYCVALADLGMALIYDPSLAHERPQEARVSQTVPVMSAKK
jgi:hypothetical protein